MQTRFLALTFLIFALTACVPATAIPAATPLPPIASPLETSTPTSTDTPSPTARLAPATPFPTWPPIPVITPDALQVAHWQEYQTELVNCLISIGGCDYPYTKMAICEWDILGRSGQEVYVWAVCGAANAGGVGPAVIHLEADGSIEKVEAPHYGLTAMADIQRLFPEDIQAKIELYFQAQNNIGPLLEKSRALGKHLLWRKDHPEEPPLIVLSATPQP